MLGRQARPPHQAGQALPAVPHRAVLGAVHRGGGPRSLRHAWWPTSWRSSPATPTTSSAASGPRWRRPPPPSTSSAPPGCATGSHTLRMACERQQVVTERPEDLDVVGHRRGPPRGGGVRLPRAPGPGRGPTGLRGGQGGGPHAAPAGRDGSWRSSTATPSPPPAPPRQVARVRGATARDGRRGRGTPRRGGPRAWPRPASPARCSCPTSPNRRGLRAVPRRAARRPGGAAGAAAGGQAQPCCRPVTRNAGEELARHRLRRASDHDSRARALESLREVLGLDQAPLRIECYDMSHLQGTDYVGSMVVLEDGLPRKSEYRRFRIRDVPGNDDYAAMEEVLTRRLTALLAARAGSRGRRRRHRWGPGPGPALRLSTPAAAPGRRQGPARGGGAGPRAPGPVRGDPRGRPGQELRGGVRPGPDRPRPHPPGVRRPVPPAAGARRGPPLRHRRTTATCGDGA